MNTNQLKELLADFSDDVKFEHDLKKNWFNIGGKAKVYYKANHLKELVKFLKIIDDRKKYLFWVLVLILLLQTIFLMVL